MTGTAIILVEARGEAVHLREDASLNLLQAALLARNLVDHGWRVDIRLIIDPGQSIAEYSILCHAEDEEIARLQAIIAGARVRREARYAVVREVRERHLPFTIDATAGGDAGVEDRLFFAALLAKVTGINEGVLKGIRAVRHPLIDWNGCDEYEQLLRAHIGASYLALEEATARWVIERCLGDAAERVTIRPVSRVEGGPQRWLDDPLCSEILHTRIDEQARGEGGTDFRSRLIGLFTSVVARGEERPYFNSPTCCRREHGKVRIMSRDRFNILALNTSERITFDRLREMIAEQSTGRGERLFALKYPYTARFIARTIAAEAQALSGGDPVQVIFVEGIEGSTNGGTGGLVDDELRSLLHGAPVVYRRLIAKPSTRQMLPNSPGGLPMIVDRLWPRIAHTIPDDFDCDGIVLCPFRQLPALARNSHRPSAATAG